MPYQRLVKGKPDGPVLHGTADLKAALPNVSFPATELSDEDLLHLGLARVEYAEQPALDDGKETLRQTAPAFVGDVLTIGWEVVPLSDEEIAGRRAPRVESFTPDQIINALDAWGVGAAVIKNADPVIYTRFVRARSVLETDDRLVAALKSVDKTPDDLRATIEKLKQG